MTSGAFRAELRRRLDRDAERVLLRVAVAPDLASPIELTGRDLVTRGAALAARAGSGTEGEVVLLLLPHSAELFLIHLGLVLEGRVPAILPWPTTRVDAAKYQRNLAHQLAGLPAGRLVTVPRLAENLRGALPYEVVALPVASAAAYDRVFGEALALGRPSAAEVVAPPLGDALFLQFSGGTTGAQKAVAVGAAMLERQLDALGRTLGVTDGDSIVSWLPMYHDMGLIACLWLPLWYGAPSLQLAAADWLLNPELLLRNIERYRGTLAWLPNFSFSYLAQRRASFTGDHALGTMRAWINCSEPVRHGSMRSFAQAFAGQGVPAEALHTCYAMAENVFAVTQSPLGAAPATVARASVEREESTPALGFALGEEVYVSSGRPLPGCEVRIVDGAGAPRGDGRAGEIWIRSPSLFAGYWSGQGVIGASLTPDGFHRTGDHGFLRDGELYVIGRASDLIIIAGQNLFPEDIEALVNTLSGVHPGRVVAFGVANDDYGTQALAIVAELREGGDAAALEREIRTLVLTALGIAPRYVFVAPERWIVKSTAGKISRRDTRERFVMERVNPNASKG